jgi:uncharacterized protein
MPSVASFLSRWSPNLASSALSTGLEASSLGDHERAFTEFRALAKQGNASAQAMLGRMYHNGEGVSVDLDEAVRWIRSAAEEGVPDAQFNLGVMYEDGKGISRDIPDALRWYRLAAQRGFVNAQINLSNCFHNGVGVDKDESLAAWWVSLAADQGDVDAQLNLGTRYMNGIGVGNDAFEALFWFNLAAKAGSVDAIHYQETVTKRLTTDQVERIGQGTDWKPKTATESALQLFKTAAGQSIGSLKQTLGEEVFGKLKIIDREIPTAGEVILTETHGIQQVTIVSNIRTALAGYDRNLDLNFKTVENGEALHHVPALSASIAIAFIRRIDDLADAGTVLGEDAADFTHNLLEYHLSLIGGLEEMIDSDTLALLLKRFSLRQALRAPGLVRYSRLDKIMLPLLPW